MMVQSIDGRRKRSDVRGKKEEYYSSRLIYLTISLNSSLARTSSERLFVKVSVTSLENFFFLSTLVNILITMVMTLSRFWMCLN